MTSRTLTLSALLVIVFLLSAPVFAADPGVKGPYAVSREDYNLGNMAFKPDGFPYGVELAGSVTYPAGLPSGPYPLVVFLHGRHFPCYSSYAVVQDWPCSYPTQPIWSYKGYDYISDVLASWGYVVVSVSANGISAWDDMTPDGGMSARAQLIQKQLDTWRTFATSGGSPFGTKFAGKIDFTKVGTMGHSRGGEGVVTHYQMNQSAGSPYGVKAVLPLAPVDFSRLVVTGAPMAVMLPYCDGDVSDLEGIHYFDDARYKSPGDPAPKHSLVVMGANHNYFNTMWTPGMFPMGTADDWMFVMNSAADTHCNASLAGNGRLTAEQQRSVGAAYVTGFFRMYLGGEDFKSYFSGEMVTPPSVGSAQVLVSYHAPDSTTSRRDLNRLTSGTNLRVNSLGGLAYADSVMPYTICGGPAPQMELCALLATPIQQPHTVDSLYAPDAPGLTQLKTKWVGNNTSFSNDLPASARDISGYSALTFRAGVNWADPLNPKGLASDMTVTLVDGKGVVGYARASAWSAALSYPPGQVEPLPRLLLHTIRIPLTAFSGVNLTDIRRVVLRFDQRTSGALQISDLSFAK